MKKNLAPLLERLHKNDPTLIELDLSNQNIGNQELNMILEALCVNTVLQKLDLSHNQIDWNGSSSFGSNCPLEESLCTLDISFNNLGAMGTKTLIDYFMQSSLHTLNLSHNGLKKERLSAIFTGCLKQDLSSTYEFTLENEVVRKWASPALVSKKTNFFRSVFILAGANEPQDKSQKAAWLCLPTDLRLQILIMVASSVADTLKQSPAVIESFVKFICQHTNHLNNAFQEKKGLINYLHNAKDKESLPLGTINACERFFKPPKKLKPIAQEERKEEKRCIIQ